MGAAIALAFPVAIIARAICQDDDGPPMGNPQPHPHLGTRLTNYHDPEITTNRGQGILR